MCRRSSRFATIAFMLSCFVAVVSVGATPGQSEPAQSATTVSEEVAGVGVLEDVEFGDGLMISLDISYASEEIVTIVVREGELATYKSFAQEESFGLIPTVDDRTGEIVLQLVSIDGERPSYRAVELQDVLRGQAGFQMVTSTADRGLPLSITPTEISECERLNLSAEAKCSELENQTGSLFVTAALKPAPGGGSGDTCCVTCGGGEWCGCSVSTPCGSCTGC